MGRTQFFWRALAAALVVLAFVFAGSADARTKKKKKKAPAKAGISSAQEKALGTLRGNFKFGMTSKQVMAVLKKQINERFAEKIAATQDVYVQDKLRRSQKKQLSRVSKSFVKFEGKKTGWDVSIVDDQFAHNTGESMMVYWETQEGKNQRRFFFFFHGKLYKMFIAMSTENLQGAKGFAFYQTMLEKRFGSGTVGFRTDKDGIEWPDHIEWKSAEYRVRAIDKLSFYGSFCLWIADPSTLKEVETLRVENAPAAEKENQVIKAITDDGADEPDLNDGSGTIDAILKGK